MRAAGALIGLWLLTGSVGHTAPKKELILAFKYDVTAAPAPETFLVTQFSSLDPNQPVQFRLPNQGAISCAGVVELPGRDGNSVCGRPPGCLAPGIYSFWVQAEYPEGPTPATLMANCEALPGCLYDCSSVALPPALQAVAEKMEAEGGRPPTAEEIEAVTQQLVPASSVPPEPSVTTPPPTVHDLLNPIQAALDGLPTTPM